MAEQPISPLAPEPSPEPASPPRRKRRRSRGRTVLIGIGIVVLLLVLLVLFAPTIASTGWARGYILGKVSEQLNGTVTAADWSLGWTSPISIDALSVKDAEGNEVIAIDAIDTQLTVLAAARQNFDIGQVTIEGLKAHIVRYADGSINLEKLLKDTPEEDTGPTELPDLRGTVSIRNAGGTFRDEAADKRAAFDLTGDVKIPGINEPITNDLRLTTRLDGAAPGTITINGQAKIAENNILQIDMARLRQALRVESIDVASLAFLVPADSGISTLAGIFRGEVNVQGAAEGLTASASLQARDFALGGPALDGDTYASNTVAVTLPPTLLTLPAEGQAIDQARLRIGDGSDQQVLRIQLQQGEITVRADARMAALTRLADNQAPGSKGHLAATVNLDVGALARQLPKLLQINEDLADLRGRLDLDARLALEPQQATPTVTLNLRDVSARNTRTNQPVHLEPVALNLSARHLGGGGALPDLRDVAVKLTSGFATADIQGQNLGSVAGTINGTLDAMQRELGQFVDFGGVQLAGAFRANLNANGEFTRPGGTSAGSITVDVTDLTLDGIADMPPIRKERLQLSASGTLRRGPEGGAFVDAIQKVAVTVQAGPQNRPWMDVELVADAVEFPTNPRLHIPLKVVRYDLRKLNLDLIAAEQQVALIEQELARRGIDISSGSIALNTAGSLDQDVLTISGFNLTTREISALQERRPVVDKLTTTLDLAGRVELGQAATIINLSRLNLSEPRNFISLKKTSGGELNFTLPATGGFAGRGQMQMTLSLAFANDILRALQAEPVAADAPGQIRRGYLDATIEFTQPQANAPTGMALNAGIKNLQITTAGGQPLDAGDVTLAARASMAADQAMLTLSTLDLTSAFVTARLADARLDLGTDNTLRLVQSARLNVDVPDAGRAWAVYQAMIPPTAQPAADDGTASLPPLRITGGRLQVEAAVRDEGGRTVIALNKLAGDDLALARGDAAHTLSPFAVTLDAALEGDAAGTLQQVLINQLDANFGFAQLKAAEPVRIAGLGGDALDASGTLTGRGDLEHVLALVNVLGASAAEPAYSGAFEFVQKLATRNDQVSLDGSLNVRDLKPTDPGAVRIDDELQVANTIRLDMAGEALNIEKLSIAMPRTQALVISLQGAINQFSTQRNLDLKAVVKTDWERLWQLVYPVLDPAMKKELADARFFGIEQRNWEIKGAYPADKPFHEAIRSMTATGGIGIKTAQAMGWDVRELDLPLELADGQLKFLFARQEAGKPYRPNAQVNGGILNLANIIIDLRGAGGPAISTPENYKLVVNAALNPVLAEKFFGKLLLAFNDASEARGQISIVITYCQGLALNQFSAVEEAAAPLAQARQADRRGDAFEQWRRQRESTEREAMAQPAPGAQAVAAPAGPGRAKILLSVSELRIGSPTLDRLGFKAVDARIDSAEFVIENGVTKSVVPMGIRPAGHQQFTTMTFDGAVRFADSRILNMKLAFPKALLPEAIREALGDRALGMLQENIMVPFSGTLDNPQFNLLEAATNSVLGGNPLDNLMDPFRNRKEDKPRGNEPISQPRPNNTTPPRQDNAPAQQQPSRQEPEAKPQDPVGGLLDLLQKHDREKREREQREREQRDAEKRAR